jgi:hypothetical protein
VIAGMGIAGVAGADQALLSDAFPGRWNSRRAIPPAVEPAATAAALALQDAGWWRPGSGEHCVGALVVASDGASLSPTLQFARDLRDRPASAIGPSSFLFSLPSSLAGVLGILFGLSEYQATMVGGAEVGIQALRHALDLLDLGRQRRSMVVVQSVACGCESDPLSSPLAVAWCLDASGGAAGYGASVACGVEVDAPSFALAPRHPVLSSLSREGTEAEIDDSGLAALPLLRGSQWLSATVASRLQSDFLVRQDSSRSPTDAVGWIYMDTKGNSDARK